MVGVVVMDAMHIHNRSALAVAVLPTLRRGFVYLDGLVVAIETDESSLHLIKDCRGRPHESSFHVFLALGRSLNVQHFVISSQFEGIILSHHAFLGQISLVAYQYQSHIFVAVALDIFDPPDAIAETLPPSDVKHNEGSSRRAVVRTSDGLELLLACCVPDLQLDHLAVDGDCLAGVLHSHCELVRRVETVLNQPTNQTRLAHSSVSNHDELEGVVVAIAKVHSY